MFWKKEKVNDSEKRLRQLNDTLKKSFANVKNDTTNIFQWLNLFYKRNIEQEQTIKKMQVELSYMPKTREDIRKIIDDYYSFEGMAAKIREIGWKVDELSRKQMLHDEHQKFQALQPKVIQKEVPEELEIDLSHIEKRLEKLEEKKLSMKEKIVKRLTRNSKEYVKSVILSYIRKYERISALQLKEIVVDEQRFCSKSSFYRLLDELEELDEVGVIKQGKEKHYIHKTARKLV